MSSLERVPPSTNEPVIPQEILELLARQLGVRLGDPHQTLGICCEQELDPEVYRWLKSLDHEDMPAIRATMSLVKGNKLAHDAPDAAKDIEHMLADYRSARSIGKILKIVWIAIAGLITALIAILKGLPDFLELLRGWLK